MKTAGYQGNVTSKTKSSTFILKTWCGLILVCVCITIFEAKRDTDNTILKTLAYIKGFKT
jgi:hypothetical protein